jgi:beta-lactamase class D
LLVLALGFAAPARAEVVCTLLVDEASGAVLLEEGDCAARATPASTFKLALAVIGFEAGILQDAGHPVLQIAAGDPDWGGAEWRKPTTPERWLRYSVVWYSQRITRALGAAKLTEATRALGYGNADFSGDAGYDNGLERAWIGSSLQISPREQVAFLRKLVLGELPVSAQAQLKARGIVQTWQVAGWRIKGKTGTAYPRRADRSFDYAKGWGWFVGWAEAEGQGVVFARLTRGEAPGSPGTLTRQAMLAEWPALMARLGR